MTFWHWFALPFGFALGWALVFGLAILAYKYSRRRKEERQPRRPLVPFILVMIVASLLSPTLTRAQVTEAVVPLHVDQLTPQGAEFERDGERKLKSRPSVPGLGRADRQYNRGFRNTPRLYVNSLVVRSDVAPVPGYLWVRRVTKKGGDAAY